MGVDISFYTLKYPKESAQKLFDYAKNLGIDEFVKIPENEEQICFFGSGQEFLIPFFKYNEEYSEKEINRESIKELASLLRDILLECEDILYNDLHKRLFKTNTQLDEDVVYDKKPIKTVLECDSICDERLKQYKFKMSNYIKNVDYDYVYPIKFLDVCIVYEHLRDILSRTEDEKIFMYASF